MVAGATGRLGVLTASKTASGAGYTLEVTFASISRPALATPFAITVAATPGQSLPSSVTVGVTREYLASLDDNGMEPLPASSFNTPGWTWWTFDVPDGERTLMIELDARLEPAVQSSRSGQAALVVDGEDKVVVDFHTTVMP